MSLNLAFAKTVRLSEAMSLQVRGEVFNALNQVNYRLPDLSILSPDFGKLTAAADARTGPIGVRLAF